MVNTPSLAALLRARELLSDVTPLASDCGAYCGAACCVSPEEGEDEAGMLLFPGERELYTGEDHAWMRIVPANLYFQGRQAELLICDGTCTRERRPLSCRFFPVAPRFGKDGLSLVMDARGAGLCPLLGSGIGGLSGAFVSAVREAFDCLCADSAQAEFVRLIDRQVKAVKRLARSLFP